MKRAASTPGGTHVGEQSLADTPKKLHKAWQFDIPPGATAGEAAELRKANGQSCRNARRKAKDEEISDKAALEPLSVRTERAGIGQGEPLGFGPERHKAQKALSKEVSRAEQSAEERNAQNERRKDQRAQERDALNERRRDQRAAEQQSVDARDALNARRRANAQVTISVRLHCALLHTTPVRLGVSNIPY